MVRAKQTLMLLAAGAAAVAAAVVIAIVLVSDRERRTLPREDGTAVGIADEAPRPVAEAQHAAAARVSLGAEEAPSPYPPVDPAEGLSVWVHRLGSKEGVAGAEVFFLDASLGDGDWSDADAEAQRYGVRARTDARGIALVPEPWGQVLLLARVEGAFGRTWEWDEATRRAEIVLEADPELAVRVVDADGRAAAGVDVLLVQRGHDDYAVVRESAASGAEGLARLHPARFAQGGLPLVAALGIEDPAALDPSSDETGFAVEIDPGALPDEPIVLTLPPTGVLDVRVVDRDGRADEASEWVRIEFAEGHGLARPRTLAGGCATFPYVRAGRPCAVRVAQLVSKLVELAPGERREVVLENTQAGVRVLARALDPARAPLAGELVRVRYLDEAGERRGETLVRADEHGVVSWSYSNQGVGRVERAELARGDRLRPPLSAIVVSELHAGRNDLGDVVLAPVPALVAGVVVDDQGVPIRGADVAGGLLAPATEATVWPRELVAVSEATGVFELHGARPAGARLFLAVDRPGFVAVRELEVVPGAHDARVVLARQGKIVGRIVVRDPFDRQKLTVLARARADQRTFHGTILAQGQGVEIGGLPGGEYGLVVRWDQEGSNVQLAELAVTVPAGASVTPPELDPLDLTEQLHDVELEVVDALERPVRELFVRVSDPGRPGAPYSSLGPLHLQGDGARHRLRVPWAVVDLELRASGLRPTTLAGVGAGARVQLWPGGSLRLTLAADDAERARGHTLEAALQPLEANLHYREPPWVALDAELGAELAHGGSGRYEVFLRATRRAPDELTRVETFVARPPLDVADTEAPQAFELVLPEALRRFLVR